MLAPFALLYACFAAGIVAGRSLTANVCLLAVSLVAAAAAMRCRRFSIALAAQLLFVFLLGHTAVSWQLRRHDTPLRRWVEQHEDEVVRVRGEVLRTPEISPEFCVLHLRLQTVAGCRLRGVARITVSGTAERYPIVGDVVDAYARLRLPARFQSEGSFDYPEYLMRQGIQVVGSVKGAALIDIAGHHRTFRALFSALRLRLIGQMISSLDQRRGGLLRALWLDDRTTLDYRTEQTLIDAGIFHVVAISGFHVAVLLGICFLILKRLIPYRRALILLSVALLFYYLLLEGRSAISRSFLVFFIFAFASWRHEKVRWGNVLFLAALLQLIANPLELFDTGYHLTYLSTGAIVFIAAPICRMVPLRTKIYRYAVEFLIVSLSIQFVLIPYQALIFHKVPFASSLANVAAIPLSSVLIAAGPVLLPLSFVFTGALKLITPVLTAFLASAELFSGIAPRVVPTPSGWLMALFYASLCAALVVRARSRAAALACTAACVGAFFLILFPPPSTPPSQLVVHFIDVGQGDAILLQYPDGTADLVDAGGSWNIDALDIGTSVLLPYFTYWRIARLHRAFITHPQADHMNGLVTLQKYVPVEEIYMSRRPVGSRGSLALLMQMSRPVREICRGSEFRQGETRIRVLAPWEVSRSREVGNDDSLVLMLEYAGKRMLLGGDAEATTEERLLQSGDDLGAEYLKVPHHGSKTSSTLPYLRQVRPRAAFICVGKHNWFGHPHPSVLQRFRSLHATVYRTDQLGTIRLFMDSGKVETFVWSAGLWPH